MRERYALWDIDNCLTDDSGRTHLIDWQAKGDARYQAYNEAMLQDPACHKREFYLLADLGIVPIFLTGRPEAFFSLTQRWLREQMCVPVSVPGHICTAGRPSILMRPDGTVGLKPVELKRRMLYKVLEVIGRSQIVGAFDDLPSVVKMYQAHGIPAKVLFVHNPSQAYEPDEI